MSRRLESEGRPATRGEQNILAKYVGWGGIKGAFPDADGNFGKGYETVGAKLKELLPADEYKTAQRSIQYAHYTAEQVVRAMWKAVERLSGFPRQGIGSVFEPGMGVGNFAGMMPTDIHAHYAGLEYDHTTARIAKLLYPKFGVRQADFTRTPLPENSVDLVIGNPPFADVAIKSDPKYAKHNFFLHDYFFAKSLDTVRPGGLLAFISSAGTMNKVNTAARDYLADRADLVGAIRLPSNTFEKNAGTEVTTDIIFLRKRFPGEPAGDRTWTQTVNVELPDSDGKPVKGAVSRYFVEHPEMVLGEQGFFDKLYQGRYAVKAKPGQDLTAELAAAIERLPADVMQPAHKLGEYQPLDWTSPEKKEGTFYVGPNGELHQIRNGAGVPLARRGTGVEGGKTSAELERIKGLIPIRDALRRVYSANLADDATAGDAARQELNKGYDAFVAKFGPINKADLQRRRPNAIQAEAARAEAREDARYAGLPFNEGTFDPSDLVARGASLGEIARARRAMREQFQAQGREWDEGDFDPEEMPDVIIDKRPNIDPFMDDPESYRLRAIEHYDDATFKAAKSAVFFENTVSRQRAPEIKSTNDALLYSLNQKGRVDIPEIARLAGKSESEALEDLGDAIFKVPGTLDSYVIKDDYLSGNVREKLLTARAEAERDPVFRRNVAALEAVQPTPLAPSQIHASLGMPWMPEKVVDQFAAEELGLDRLKTTYIPSLAQWVARGDKTSAAAVSTWGTARRSAPELIEDLLNRRQIKIYDQFIDDEGKKRSELNVEATQAAQDKAQAIRDKFNQWIWADPARAEELSELYNQNYNNLVVREYDGSYLTTPGVSTAWSWRPHQKRVIARIIQSGNTYMAHAVGAGKTSAMIGSGMEMRRLGLIRKPMYVVPNHMLAQFTKEFYEQYPTANIAVADERRFHTDRRKQFVANVANEDLDAVVITHSAFGMIPVSHEFADKVVQDEVAHYRELLEHIPEDAEHRVTRSRIEKQIERMEQRLTGRESSRKDQVITFEEMGVDFLFVDEAQAFRKLDFSTQMGTVKGISPEGSQKAWDLHVKALYLDTINPQRNLVLASGTPVTNTMAELFTVSRYLQPHELQNRGLGQFDAWASAFGEPATELEQDAAGGYKPQTRFARFVNVAELSAMVRQVMDVVTSKQLEQYVVRPKLKDGKREMRLAEKSPALERYQRGLAKRMEAIQARRGPPKKGDDIMLSVINDGRHAAIDLRLVGAAKDPNSKLTLMVNDVYNHWKATKRQKFYAVKDGAYDLSKPAFVGPATQMVFANLGLSGVRGFSVPDFIRSELVRRGVPKNQIAYIYDYKSHMQKQRLFNDMNEGKVRILIGSTAKMGTGVNAQRRLSRINNLDPLWYPSDDEQRNGRGLRQGNMNPELEIGDYSTKGTYDSTMWGMMARKGRFIQAFFEGDPSLRDMDDLGEASQYEQAKAITTNDPRLIELTELRQKLEKANRRWAAFDQELHALKTRRASARRDIAYNTERAAAVEKDIKQREDIGGNKFSGVIGKTRYAERGAFGEAMLAAMDKLALRENIGKHFNIGQIGGFPIFVTVRPGLDKTIHTTAELRLNAGAERTINAGTSAQGAVRSIEAILSRLERDRDEYAAKVKTATRFLAESEEGSKATFTGQGEIEDLAGKVRALEAELSKATSGEVRPPETDPATISSLDALRRLGIANEADVFAPGAGLAAAMARPARRRARSLGIPAEAAVPIASFTNDQAMKAHPDYRAAKAGDGAAAARLVMALVKPEQVAEAKRRFGSDVTYVPVIAEEATGDNAIPDLLASLYAARTGAQSTSLIKQANRAYHTGGSAMERIANRAVFSGPVTPGKRYVLVDDVSVMGSTLAELANHIQQGGGKVAGVVTLVNASRTAILTPSPAAIRDIERRFGHETSNLWGIAPSALTADEADYLRNFRDVDGLRARAASAKVAREARLRAKGLLPEIGPDDTGEETNGTPLGAVSDSGDDDTSAAMAAPPALREAAIGQGFPLFQGHPARAEKPQPSRGLSDAAERRRLDEVERRRVLLRGSWTDAAKARQAELASNISNLISLIAGPRIAVRFHDTIATTASGWGDNAIATAGGEYLPIENLIRIALHDPNYHDKAATAFHESWHAVEDHFIDDHEMALMKREEPKLRQIAMRHYGFSEREAAQLADYEVRAIAFEAYAADRAQGGHGTGLHIGIRRVFERLLNLFKRIANYLRGEGFRTVRDILSDTYEGKMRQRPSRKIDEGKGSRLAEAIRAERDAEPWASQAAPRRPAAGARPSISERIRERIADAFDSRLAGKIVEGGQDLSHPVRLLQDLLEARRGAPFNDLSDFYTRKRLYPGRVGNEVRDFNTEHLDPLVAHMKANAISLQQGGDYVYAKHVAERNAELGKLYPPDHPFFKAMTDPTIVGASGRSQQWADNVLREAVRLGKAPALEQVAARVQGIRQYILDKMSNHLVTPQTAEAWRQKYRHYVDLRGFEDAPDEAPSDYREPARFNVRGKEVKQAFGRRSKADNPIVNMLDQAYRTIDRDERNRYLHAVWNALGRMNAESPGSISDIVKLDKGTTTKTIDKKTGLIRTVDNAPFALSPNTVTTKINGQPHHMVFESRDIAEAIKRMAPEGLGMFQGLLTLENKLKSLWTHYSPDFLFRHFVFRYPIEGTLNSFEQKESGEHRVSQYIANSLPFFGRASRAIFAANKGEALDSPEDKEMQGYWQEMRRAGGSMTFRSSRDMDLLREHLQTQLMALKGKPITTAREKWRRAIEAMDTVTNALDNSLRLAAYASARKQGKTPQQAALIAREATVDFQLKGKWANAIGLWWPFGNVAIQTGARMTKAVYRSKIMRHVFMGTMLAGFLTAAFNYLIGGNDKDGVPFFEKIPEWDRRLNFILLNPFDRDEKGRPTPFKIPMPYNWAFPLMLGYAFGTQVFGKEAVRKTLGVVARSGIEVLTPFGQEENVAAMLAPELSRPAIYLATNKDYAGRPIHMNPDYQKGPNAESGKRDIGGRVRTGEGWKYLASSLNRATGGSRTKSGWIDLYPEDIRQVFDYVGGSQRRLGQNIYETGKSIAQGKAPDPTHVPLERVIRGTDYDAADRSLLYERLQKQKQPWLH